MIGESLFKMPSITTVGVTYIVDMKIGICECNVRQNGDVCKHQYILWAFGKAASTNFLPYLSPLERKRYAEIAIGSSMETERYEGIHDRIMDTFNTSENITDKRGICYDETFSIENSHDIPTPDFRRTVEGMTIDQCKEELKQTIDIITGCLDFNSENYNLMTGVMKFCQHVKKFPVSRLSTALHSFGVPSSTNLKVTATSVLKKARRGKIYVQPEAVKRRKCKDGSRKSKIKGMSVKNNPFIVEPATKRPHSFAQNVCDNVAVAKKAGRTMSSKTKHLQQRCKPPADGDNKNELDNMCNVIVLYFDLLYFDLLYVYLLSDLYFIFSAGLILKKCVNVKQVQ